MYEALHISLISSDESDAEGDALSTRPLTWRTDDVNQYFQLLDELWKAGMTSQQKQQSVSRLLVFLVEGPQLESHKVCFGLYELIKVSIQPKKFF